MKYSIPTIKESNQNAQNKKAVAFCVDRTYLPYASFVAHQIIAKEQKRDFDILICIPHTESIPSTDDNGQIRYCSIDYSCITNLPVGRLSAATYYKIFLPAIFQDDYEQILYLDADVYISKSNISALMEDHKHDKGLVMAVDISEIERKSGLNIHNAYLSRYIKLKHQYRNAGVILFNSKKLLEINYLQLLLNYAHKNKNKLLRHDQTLLNTVLHNEISSLSFLYNYQLIETTIPLLQDFKPNIMHFVGELKPWNTEHGYIGTFHSEFHTFIQENFPNIQLHSKSEFELKLESRKKRHKYKNPFREQLSLQVFIGKDKLKRVQSYFYRTTNEERLRTPKIISMLSKFRASIHLYINECEISTIRR